MKSRSTRLKEEVWNLLEKELPNMSDKIGWGSMDTLCEDLIELIKE